MKKWSGWPIKFLNMSNTNLTNSNQERAQETNESIIFPPFNQYSKNDLEFSVFSPQKGLYYCFFGEKTEPNSFILSKDYTTLFDLANVANVQRFCYYPGTQNIYTFLGFQNKDQRDKAMKNKLFLRSIVNGVVSIYPLDDKAPKKHQKQTKSKNQSTTTEKNDYSKLPKSVKYRKDLGFTEFVPKNNYVYIFFTENQAPKEHILKNDYQKIYGIDFSLDIQRFCYYPGTKKVYSFMGFLNKKVAEKAIKRLKAVVSNMPTFNYPYQEEKTHIQFAIINNDSANNNIFDITEYKIKNTNKGTKNTSSTTTNNNNNQKKE